MIAFADNYYNRQPGNFRRFGTVFLILLVASTSFAGEIYTENPDTYLARLKLLQPGDQLRLLPGEYKNGLPVHFLQGKAEAPILISGPQHKPYAIFSGQRGRNTVSILNSSHVTIRNLEINGHHLPVDGVKCEGHADWAHHITLENLWIHQHDHNYQTVAISTKCPAWNWIIRRNIIQGAGTGLYLGNSDGSAPFIGGVIEYNLITETLGYNLQIKHQQPRPNIPGMPQRDQVTIVRHNVFSKADHNSKGIVARPNVLVGHWPLTGPGQNDQYLIYGNFFYQNAHESLFQGEGNLAIYNNLFVNHQGSGIRIQPHNDIPRKTSIFFNTILASGTGIHLMRGKSTPSFPQKISGNAVFAGKPLSGSATGAAGKDNFIQGFETVRIYLSQPLLPPGKMDLRPLPHKMHQMKIDSSQLHAYPEWNRDFDGREGNHRFGAYVYGKALGWLPRLGIKPGAISVP